MSASVLTNLTDEWIDLLETGRFCDRIDEWAQRWPNIPLAHLSYSQEPTFPRLTPAQADQVFLGLISDWQLNNDYDAGRFVLQCMLRCVDKTAQRCIKTHARPYEAALADALAGMWEAISVYDLSKTSDIARGLMFSMLDSMSSPAALARLGVHETPVDDFLTNPDGNLPQVGSSIGAELRTGNEALSLRLSTTLSQQLTGTSILGPLGEVLEVIHWGLAAGVLSPNDADLLTRMYAPDPDLPEYEELSNGRGRFQARIAAELGVSHDALRQSASRAVRRLVEAVVA